MVCASVLAGALSWSSTASAQSDDERARMHFQAGSSYFEQGRYDDALREWQESYRLSNRHVLLRNIATAQERLFQFNEAIDSLQRYLSLGGAEAEENRNTIESRIEGLRRDAERFAASGGASHQTTTPTQPPPMETPTETSRDQTSTVTPAETEPLETEPVEPVEGGVVETQPRRRIGTWISFGAAGLFGVGAIITGALALSKRSELNKTCTETDDGYNCDSNLQSDAESMRTLAILTDVFIGLGSAAAIAGLVLFFLEGRNRSAEARLRPILGFGNAGLALSF